MAAGVFTLYSATKASINMDDLAGATLKLALFSSVYTPDDGTSGDAVLADISANEIQTRGGYTAGGDTLTNVTVTPISSGYKIATSNADWVGVGDGVEAWRYAVMYVSGSLWGLTNPLIGYFLGDSTPADVPITPSGNTLTIACPADGWFDVT